MSPANSDCLPIARVIETVAEVESALERFYESALESITDENPRLIMTMLRKSKKGNTDTVRKLCAAAACGAELTEDASSHDIDFLSTLVQSAFYSRTGPMSLKADSALETRHLVENALKLERDLMLFYLRFYSVSCREHRPMVSELIRGSENAVTELTNLRSRLLRQEGQV